MVEWITSENPVGYEEAVRWMEARVADILAGRASEAIWLLEHPPLYTAGTSADAKDLTDPDRFDVFQAQRGGQSPPPSDTSPSRASGSVSVTTAPRTPR